MRTYLTSACAFAVAGTSVPLPAEVFHAVRYVYSNADDLVAVRYRFQCREWSAATGLINFRMRWYDPVTGRWLSKDPIGLNGGLNLYAFCDNKPILYMDPYGKFWGAIISAITTVAIVAYTIIRHALRMKKKMDEADQNDLKDVTIHAIDCTEETLDAITSPLGPPPPTPTSLILDPLVHEITYPIWNEKFNQIRPLK